MMRVRVWVGLVFVRLGLWIAPSGHEAVVFELAEGDDLTCLGALVGITRDTDYEFRTRVEAVIRGRW